MGNLFSAICFDPVRSPKPGVIASRLPSVARITRDFWSKKILKNAQFCWKNLGRERGELGPPVSWNLGNPRDLAMEVAPGRSSNRGGPPKGRDLPGCASYKSSVVQNHWVASPGTWCMLLYAHTCPGIPVYIYLVGGLEHGFYFSIYWE